jgi:hypothetical protein
LEELRKITKSLVRLVAVTLDIGNRYPPIKNKVLCSGATWLGSGYINVTVKEN